MYCITVPLVQIVYFCSWFKLFTSKQTNVGTRRSKISTKANSFPDYQGIKECNFLHVMDVFWFHLWHMYIFPLLRLIWLHSCSVSPCPFNSQLYREKYFNNTVTQCLPQNTGCPWAPATLLLTVTREKATILSGFHRPRISCHPLCTNYWSALDKRTLMKKKERKSIFQLEAASLLYHTSGSRRTHNSIRWLWWNYRSDDNCGGGQTNTIKCKELGFNATLMKKTIWSIC